MLSQMRAETAPNSLYKRHITSFSGLKNLINPLNRRSIILGVCWFDLKVLKWLQNDCKRQCPLCHAVIYGSHPSLPIHINPSYVQLNNYVTNIDWQWSRPLKVGRVCRSLREFLGSLPVLNVGKHFVISQAFPYFPPSNGTPFPNWARPE